MQGHYWDGVLFKGSLKTPYWALQKRKQENTFWLFFGFWPDKEKEAGWEAMAEIDQLLVEWEPPAELKNGQQTYSYKLEAWTRSAAI